MKISIISAGGKIIVWKLYSICVKYNWYTNSNKILRHGVRRFFKLTHQGPLFEMLKACSNKASK